MKKILALVLAVLTLGMCAAGCKKTEDDLLTAKYNYDLSEYIKLAEYKNLPAVGYHIEVTDEAIEQQILSSRSYYSRLNDVTDRGAALGDTVYIDYVGTIGGEEFDGGSETDAELVLGSGTYFDDFENAIVGAMPESTLSVDLTFPDPYYQFPEHAGEDVHFEITVHEVCEQELPEYTEDFVRAYLGYGSKAEYEAAARQSLEDYYRDIYYQYVSDQVWDVVYENTEVIKWPDTEVSEYYNAMVESNQAYAEVMGLNFATYVSLYFDGMTEEEFYSTAKEEAEQKIKEEMIVYAIARRENLSLSEAEYTKRATEYATKYYEMASLEAFEETYDKPLIRQTILSDLVHEFIVDHADVEIKN
ncbi:MAG: trigger factor [Clostridia bacterium]|nr:trigger factor [Clostridia bacterium]